MEKTTILYHTDDVFIIEVVIGQARETIDIRKEMTISHGNLVKDISEQPGKYAWYSAIVADQEDQAASKKREMERRRADLALQLRQGKLKISDEKGNAVKITEGGVQDYIDNDKQMVALQDELFSLESICKKFRVLVNASVQRKDMLIQLGLLERNERKQFNQ